MAVISSLKKGFINPYTFTTSGPGPAKVYIEIDYKEEWKYLLGYKGFKQEGELLGSLITSGLAKLGLNVSGPDNQAPIRFQLPVTPPTIQIDRGNDNDSSNVVQVGEVVLPKYSKAQQFRFDSFFPYDASAPYINTAVKQSGLAGLASSAVDISSSIAELHKAVASPQIYIDIFNKLSKNNIPFKISMNFYQGGNIGWTYVTVNTFQLEPENNGDYKYQLSLIEWTNIAPTKLNPDGTPAFKSTVTLGDIKTSVKSPFNMSLGYANTISHWWNLCKGAYSIVSKNLIFWVAKYNGLKDLFYIRKGDFTWKFKNEFQSYANRYSLLPNIIDKSSISTSDTSRLNEELKKLSFTKASKQMEEYLKSLGYDIKRTSS